MSEVRIWRYLVFWALKKVKGPNRRVKMLCKRRQPIKHSQPLTGKLSV